MRIKHRKHGREAQTSRSDGATHVVKIGFDARGEGEARAKPGKLPGFLICRDSLGSDGNNREVDLDAMRRLGVTPEKIDRLCNALATAEDDKVKRTEALLNAVAKVLANRKGTVRQGHDVSVMIPLDDFTALGQALRKADGPPVYSHGISDDSADPEQVDRARVAMAINISHESNAQFGIARYVPTLAEAMAEIRDGKLAYIGGTVFASRPVYFDSDACSAYRESHEPAPVEPVEPVALPSPEPVAEPQGVA